MFEGPVFLTEEAGRVQYNLGEEFVRFPDVLFEN